MKEFIKEITYAILSTAICFIFFYSGRYLTLMEKRYEMKREIKPCKCVSYKEFTFRQAKYEMYVNKLNYNFLSKSENKKATDSLNKYRLLLQF